MVVHKDTQSVPFIIAGLGNPGKQYSGSRHNVGFQCIEYLARRHQLTLGDRRNRVTLGQGFIHGRPVVIAKPRTYVNSSGAAIRYLTARFGTTMEMLMVVTDDMDLPLGKLRIKPAGGSGGHNGLNSIIEAVGAETFPRMRIGIGRPIEGAIGHVLGSFTREEMAKIQCTMVRSAEALESWLQQGVVAAMNEFN